MSGTTGGGRRFPPRTDRGRNGARERLFIGPGEGGGEKGKKGCHHRENSAPALKPEEKKKREGGHSLLSGGGEEMFVSSGRDKGS